MNGKPSGTRSHHGVPMATAIGGSSVKSSSSSNPKYSTLPTATVLTTTAEHSPTREDSQGFISHESLSPSLPPPSSFMEEEFVRGQVQAPEFRDKWFAIAFLVHIGIIVIVAILFAAGVLKTTDIYDSNPPNRLLTRVLKSAYGDDDLDDWYAFGYSNSSSTEDSVYDDDFFDVMDVYRFLSSLFISLILAPVLAVFAMGFMHRNAVHLIKFSLCLPVALNFLVVLLILGFSFSNDGDSDGGNTLAIIGPLVVAVVSIWYARAIWHRIPFAAANLKTAISCVRSNLGMAILGLSKILIYITWIIVWAYTFSCVMDSPMMQSSYTENTDDNLGDDGGNPLMAFVFLGFLLSFCWTWQVIKNIVHCSLVGTVGTWWFIPQEASCCCSRALTGSLWRSLTYSLGSICFGSLLVAIIEIVKGYVRSLARKRGALLLYCIAQCLLGWIERLAQYFNKWAYVYVGVYGYSYMDAGKNVLTLFQNRGWSTIISDLLVIRMLGLMSLCVGFITALAAVIMTLGADSEFMFVEALYAFLYAFVTGTFMSSFVFSVLVSANDAIIVLFCEAPGEFAANHPALSREMTETWLQTFPDVISPSESTAEAVAVREVV